MKVCVTGGAGFMGINLIRYFLNKGWEVVSLDVAPFEYPEKNQIRVVTGDIRNTDDVREAVRGCDVVVHTAAALPLYTPEDIRSTDIKGTETVFQVSLEEGASRVIHTSSTAVYGIPDHHPLVEDDELVGVGEYGKAKIKAEEIGASYRKKGLVVPIIRPKSFVGPERLGVFALLYDWAHTGHHFPMIGSGNNRYQLLDVEDLCDAVYLCATKDESLVNDTFNIGAREFTTMKNDYQAVLDAAGHGKKVIGFPAAPMIWALRVLEFFKLSPIYKWVYETASKDSFVSIEKAEKQLGFSPKYSNIDALLRNYAWYVEHLDEFKGASGVSHRVPWKQGILEIAKIFFKKPFQIVRYLLSGLTGIATNLGTVYVLVDIVKVHYLVGSVFGVVLSMIVGFLLQKFWTFEEHSVSRAPLQFLQYIGLAIFNLFVNTAIVFSLVEWLAFHYLVAQTVGIAVVAVFSFFVYRWYIFKKR